MIILGIDPGLRKTGWAVLERNHDGNIFHIESGVFVTKAGSDWDAHQKLRNFGYTLANQWKPGRVVMERVFMGPNRKSALSTSEARGSLKSGLSCYVPLPLLLEPPPAAVKKGMTGNGRADKLEVMEAVRERFMVDCASPDQGDAVACAWWGRGVIR